jgi:cytochrome c oxidase accessory protein FixG
VTTVLDRRNDPARQPRGRAMAAAVEAHDVSAVNRAADRHLYAARQKIHPRLAHGRFRAIKWVVMAVALAIYYGLPWLRWNRGPDLPDQAVLLDMAHNRFFFFFLEIWPQEFYFVTGLLVLAALSLFLVTSIAGRVWCGYACPQTVWTDLMVAVERLWQGDRNARIRLDKEPWRPRKVFLKAMTHLTWLLIGLVTGGAMVFYFRDAPTLAGELATGTAPAIAYLFLGIFTATTYLLGGIAREQVCIYMCPWPRIQGAMTDGHTLLVSYRAERGEPRGPARKGPDGLVDWSARGDCIDCKACVVVCPMGIDIRDGSQLECIQCALCIDACNEIMDKIDRPRGLIAYDTIARQEAGARGVRHEPIQLFRPRTLLYVAMISLVGVIMLVALWHRTTLELNVQHDRNPPFVRLSEGGIRNGFTVKILNKLHEPRTFVLTVEGLPEPALSMVAAEPGAPLQVTVPTNTLRELRVFVIVSRDRLTALKEASTSFTFEVRDIASGQTTRRGSLFQAPLPTGAQQ